jgi:hypothetical protein
MQFVDLVGGEHRCDFSYPAEAAWRQDVVVCKIPTAVVCGVEVLPAPRLARELSCCLQDCADAVFGPERAAKEGERPRLRHLIHIRIRRPRAHMPRPSTPNNRSSSNHRLDNNRHHHHHHHHHQYRRRPPKA